MKVGYAVLYNDGELVISKNHIILSKKIEIDYSEFEDTLVPWNNESKKIEKIQIFDQVKSNCMSKWFDGCRNLTTLLDFKNLDVSDCADFSYMFRNCESLQNLNGLQNWNVLNGTNFFAMFYKCKSLQWINELQNWNVFNGIDFSYMFSYCASLKDITALTNWNVSNGIKFSYMFANCKSLKNITLPQTLKKITTDMFYHCNNIQIKFKKYYYNYNDLLSYDTF